MIKMQLAWPIMLCSVCTPFLQSFPTALLFYWNFFLTLSWTAVVCHQAVVVLHPRDARGSVTDPSARDVSTLWCGTGIQIFQDKWHYRHTRAEFTKWKMRLWCCYSFLTVSLFQSIPAACSQWLPQPLPLSHLLVLHWYVTAAHTRESVLPLGPGAMPAAQTRNWETKFGNGLTT